MHPPNLIKCWCTLPILNLVQLPLPQQFRTLLVRCQADTKILSGNWTIPLCSWWINRIGRGGEVRRAKSIPYYQFTARLTVSISIEVDKNNATMHRCREGAQLHHHRPLNRTIAALYSSKDSAPIKITAKVSKFTILKSVFKIIAPRITKDISVITIADNKFSNPFPSGLILRKAWKILNDPWLCDQLCECCTDLDLSSCENSCRIGREQPDMKPEQRWSSIRIGIVLKQGEWHQAASWSSGLEPTMSILQPLMSRLHSPQMSGSPLAIDALC